MADARLTLHDASTGQTQPLVEGHSPPNLIRLALVMPGLLAHGFIIPAVAPALPQMARYFGDDVLPARPWRMVFAAYQTTVMFTNMCREFTLPSVQRPADARTIPADVITKEQKDANLFRRRSHRHQGLQGNGGIHEESPRGDRGASVQGARSLLKGPLL
jgi:hypothetical protein